MKVYLASASPRRREILNLAGIKHSVIIPEVSEEFDVAPDTPAQTVEILSERKAKAALELLKDEKDDFLVIAADTVVALGDNIFGKPRGTEDAFNTVRSLSGERHEVYTGVTVASRSKTVSFVEQSSVYFRDLSDEEIEKYIKTGEPMDKAGAYGIQGKGCVFVKRIEGDYFNIVGLPIYRVYCVMTNDFSYNLIYSE
ncbi:MAG: septum formation protein Maf [Clostridiales bacterium]|jgi:septum formation protein|nr:septum formation protein Maf [Clostridiales bacterium]